MNHGESDPLDETIPMRTGSTHVLHVVESFGGGTAFALLQYVRSTPEVTHHLIRRVRNGEYVGEGELHLFATVHDLPARPLAARRAIRQAVREVRPSVIHAHSSFGGAFARISVRARATQPIVYTPHGFSFERRDISSLKRTVFRTMERVLAKNTTIIAACAPREAALARRLGVSDVIYVPNVAVIPPDAGRAAASAPLVAGAGRLSPARDPHYFLDAVKRIRSANPNATFVWVGGGPDGYRTKLEEHGVRVTGWLSRREALDQLSQAAVYLHTGAWDGFPMSVLEATALGVPTLARLTPAFDHVPAHLTFETPSEMADAAGALLNQRAFAQHVRDSWQELLQENSEAVQRSRLLEVYECAAEPLSES